MGINEGEPAHEPDTQPILAQKGEIFTSPLAETPSEVSVFTPMQLHFLLRLSSLLKRKRQFEGVLPPTDWRMRLFHKSIYSTFTDCAGLNIAREARDLFQGEIDDSPPPQQP